MKKITKALAIAGIAVLSLTACDDADSVNHNISKDADNFKVAEGADQ